MRPTYAKLSIIYDLSDTKYPTRVLRRNIYYYIIGDPKNEKCLLTNVLILSEFNTDLNKIQPLVTKSPSVSSTFKWICPCDKYWYIVMKYASCWQILFLCINGQVFWFDSVVINVLCTASTTNISTRTPTYEKRCIYQKSLCIQSFI